MVEARKAQVIIAERFDRLFRDIDVQRQTIRRIEAAGGRLESPKQGTLSHATAEAEMHANIDAVVSQYQRRTATDRAWDAVEVAIEQGKAPGHVPPGLRRGPDGVLVPASRREVKTVRDAFERRAGGATIGEVRAFLAKRGIERTLSGVRRMLSSRLYIGEVRFGAHTPNLRAHEPIVDRDVFDAAQKMIVRAGRKAKSERLLARLGVLRCGSCQGRMSASTGKDNTYPTYRCAGEDCDRPLTIGAAIVEREVIAAVTEAASSRKGRAKLAQQARRAAEEAERAHAAYAKAQRILADADDEAEAQKILAEKRVARDEKRELADRLADLVGPEVIVDVADVFEHGTIAEQRAAVRSRVRQVTVQPGRGPERITIELLGE